MRQSLSHPIVAVVFVIIACWDAWRWYMARIAATPEEAVALALTIGLVVAIAAQDRQRVERLRPISLYPLAGLLALYAIATAIAPSIVAAALGAIALLVAVYVSGVRKPPPIALYGLAALSLPVLPSLQFVLGYPMRLILAAITVALLQVQGLAVTREGTNLLWAGEAVQFDAPCSGVNMLWAGVMLTLAACVVWRSGVIMTAIAVAASLALTTIANVLRAVSLFYIESGLISGAAPWWHDAIGLAAFAISAAVTLSMLNFLRAKEAALWTH